MNSVNLRRGLFGLVGYMLTSARGLVDEPKLYGPFRLIDGVSRLCDLLIDEDEENSEFYRSLKSKIDEKKYSVISDTNSYIINFSAGSSEYDLGAFGFIHQKMV